MYVVYSFEWQFNVISMVNRKFTFELSCKISEEKTCNKMTSMPNQKPSNNEKNYRSYFANLLKASQTFFVCFLEYP